jgi:hypothetical protein
MEEDHDRGQRHHRGRQVEVEPLTRGLAVSEISLDPVAVVRHPRVQQRGGPAASDWQADDQGERDARDRLDQEAGGRRQRLTSGRGPIDGSSLPS